MKCVSRTVIALIVVLLLGSTFSFAQTPKPLPRVTIGGSELRTMKSASTGRDYDLYIHIPSDYVKNKGKKYPVLYILDGQWDFKLMDSVLGGLVYDKFVPEMILVGITYSGENADYNSLRAMDLTPTAARGARGQGDGPKFYKFITSEVVPFIESTYRADASKRFLQGSSLGGLFTLYAMFTNPDFFAGYIAASPSVPNDDGYEFRQEAEYARTHKDLKTRLYLAVGSNEGLTMPVREFMKVLQSRNYNGLKMQTLVATPEGHASNKPEVYNRGLRFVAGE